jgi:hypothetical protein
VPCFGLLRIVRGKDGGPILRANIVTLAHALRRVMPFPKDL